MIGSGVTLTRGEHIICVTYCLLHPSQTLFSWLLLPENLTVLGTNWADRDRMHLVKKRKSVERRFRCLESIMTSVSTLLELVVLIRKGKWGFFRSKGHQRKVHTSRILQFRAISYAEL